MRKIMLLRVALGCSVWLLISGCTHNHDEKPSMTTISSPTPDQGLENAIHANDPLRISSAIAAGANVNTTRPNGATPLMLAVDLEHDVAVQTLLQAGADPNFKNNNGASAVYLAVEKYRRAPGLLHAMLKAGGDPNTRRPDNDPIIMRFINDRNCEAIRYLKSVGADLEVKTRAGDALVSDAAVAMDWDVVWCLLELGANPDQEHTRLPLTRSLARKVPSPDSPIYPYKQKVWSFMHDKGFAVQPLQTSTP